VARELTLMPQGTLLSTPDVISFFGFNHGQYLPVPLLIMLVFFGLTALVLTRTYSGREVRHRWQQEAVQLCGLTARAKCAQLSAADPARAPRAGIPRRRGAGGPARWSAAPPNAGSP
jgi:ribose transport system permease protein